MPYNDTGVSRTGAADRKNGGRDQARGAGSAAQAARKNRGRARRKWGTKTRGLQRGMGFPAAPTVVVRHRAQHSKVDLIIAECHTGCAAEALAHSPDRLGAAAGERGAGTVAQEPPTMASARVLAAVDPAHAHAKPRGWTPGSSPKLEHYRRRPARSGRRDARELSSGFGLTLGEPGIDAVTLAMRSSSRRASRRISCLRHQGAVSRASPAAHRSRPGTGSPPSLARFARTWW